jgi:hypothetical protein
MDNPQRRRRTVWLLIAISACVSLVCCGVLAGLLDHFTLSHVYTYEQSAPAQIDGVSVEVTVLPEKRIKTPPDRLVGPPYTVCLRLIDTSRSAVAAKLHNLRLKLQDGRTVNVQIPKSDFVWKEERVDTMVSTKVTQGRWGSRPTIVADVEINFPDRTVREKIEIPLAARHTRSLYVP